MTEIRFIEPDEARAYEDAISFGFGHDPSRHDEDSRRFQANNPVATSIVAVDRGRIVGTFGSYDLDVTMPGGATVPTAGTTHVTVHPTHRRQGILTGMMRLHLDQAVERGQPQAGLWASEERIYGRFGYGPAASGQELLIPDRTVEGSPPDPSVTVHPLDVDEARSVLPPIYERRRADLAGSLVRGDDWWEHRILYDPEHRRRGHSALRVVVAERDGRPVGYLLFRLKQPDSWAEGQTRVIELVADDDGARRSLWHFATNVDLFRNVRWWNAPMDEPLLIEADRFRQISRTVMDSVWLRPLDVPALLSARRYERDGTLVIGVDDRFGPTAGRYRLEVADGVAGCQRTDHEPEVALAVEDLGRLVLGWAGAISLGRAGLVDGCPEAIATLHDLLVTRVQPHCPEVF